MLARSGMTLEIENLKKEVKELKESIEFTRIALIAAARRRNRYGAWCNVCNGDWENHIDICIVKKAFQLIKDVTLNEIHTPEKISEERRPASDLDDSAW